MMPTHGVGLAKSLKAPTKPQSARRPNSTLLEGTTNPVVLESTTTDARPVPDVLSGRPGSGGDVLKLLQEQLEYLHEAPDLKRNVRGVLQQVPKRNRFGTRQLNDRSVAENRRNVRTLEDLQASGTGPRRPARRAADDRMPAEPEPSGSVQEFGMQPQPYKRGQWDDGQCNSENSKQPVGLGPSEC